MLPFMYFLLIVCLSTEMLIADETVSQKRLDANIIICNIFYIFDATSQITVIQQGTCEEF